MNLKLFPLDTQTCHLTIASYGWTSRDLQYIWKVRHSISVLKYIYIYSDKRSLESTFYTNKKKLRILYQIRIPEIL